MIVHFEPASEEGIATVVRAMAAERASLTVIGGGTRSGLGNPVRADRVLSTRRLSGIVSYNPAEMTVSALAGTPLAEVEAALAENRQMLSFEPMDHRPIFATTGEPTIGGVFAANVSGPRRLIAGAARDSLLGVRFVNGRGDAIKAGGRVMKNVTGLDLVKLLAGSHGTLGILTEVTFRVLPKPPACETVVVSGLNDAEAAAVMAEAMAQTVEVSGAAHLAESVRGRFIAGGLPDGAATVLRLEGLQASVSIRAEKLSKALEKFGPVSRLDAEQTAALWLEIRDVKPYADGTDRPLWRVSVAPSAGHQLVAALRLQTGVDAFYDWQGGLVWLRMEADPEAALVRRYIKALGGGHASLVRAADGFRATIPSFEPQPAPVALLSERVREKFDPQRIFNPGRMQAVS
ncbi:MULTISPECIES: glycolate oxidase subunit GlcE [Ensifer]|jgi:glycolate oxidase FAD binding subunit|uniref:Glycolate oxidase subunit GlcE n=1 Tax=Ensifer canadensis TaxID=555315 RepID=A0AAW4FFQ9_9HYPH|nr:MULTISPECIES: glycolate oxidase subunit GlcE [Ensifer]MDP9628288.1 glycolate oxidase FAD binding subunit [Ensifer adhaerens]KQU71722.1 2-hydroxy-acid oxidase [Ensifer sp. Root31]KQW62650.1 2-hydroxy-acid oxidase [Ensifer sp. Root1252]KQW84766.1 2-hydroxy-acid oxidase [Ensifer sp. Root127]KRC83470.1 2-hydroxy-acid oxidase [Ensifer sp. Root231]